MKDPITKTNYVLKIEKGKNYIWGHLMINNHLICDGAETVKELFEHIKYLMQEEEGINPGTVNFIIKDITKG